MRLTHRNPEKALAQQSSSDQNGDEISVSLGLEWIVFVFAALNLGLNRDLLFLVLCLTFPSTGRAGAYLFQSL